MMMDDGCMVNIDHIPSFSEPSVSDELQKLQNVSFKIQTQGTEKQNYEICKFHGRYGYAER